MALTPQQRAARDKARRQVERLRAQQQALIQTLNTQTLPAIQQQMTDVQTQIRTMLGNQGGETTVVPTTTQTTPATTPSMQNAANIIQQTLASYGLGELSGIITSALTDARYRLPDGSLATGLVWEEIRASQPYKTRFAAKLARDAKIQADVQAGRTPSLAPISEAEQLNLEKGYRQVAASKGLPLGFYDNVDDFTNLITNDISTDEFEARINLAYEASQIAPPEVKAALRTRYGLGDQDIMAFYLDPTKAKNMAMGGTLGELARGLNTATLEATGLVSGPRAAELAAEFAPGTEMLSTRGVTEAAAALAPLTRTSVEGVTSMATGEDVLRATMGQQAAKGRLERERRSRLAEYEAGGGIATTGQGVVGLRTTTM